MTIKLLPFLVFFLCVYSGISQVTSLDYKNGSPTFSMMFGKWAYSDVVSHTRCDHGLSDSLKLLIDSFTIHDTITGIDSALVYTYQFTEIINLEIDFRNELHRHDCYVVEESKSIDNCPKFNQWTAYDNKWMSLEIKGLPVIGNSTYITNRRYYFSTR